MKHLLVFCLFVFLSFTSLFGQNAENVVSNKTHKVVLQLTSADSLTQKGVIKNLNNLKEAMPNIQMELVLHGMGVDLVQNTTSIVKSELTALTEKGLKIVVCENTLRERKINKDNIFSMAQYVRAGIAELILKQEEGWSYIRLGR